MAAATLHFAAGMAVGTAMTAPALRRAWRDRHPLARLMLRAILLVYGLGIYAMTPNLLRRIGCPENICTAWWTNLFLFHRAICCFWKGGRKLGEAAIGALGVLQYAALLLAVRRAKPLFYNKARGMEKM